MMKKFMMGLFVGLSFASGMILTVNAEDDSGKTTLENLQASYNSEVNAKTRYEAFAVTADEEGYKSVAALFRAASRSEGIHAQKQAAVIEDMGASPKAEIVKPEVKSTQENLETAQKSVTEENDKIYPAFIKQAEKDKNSAAIRMFKSALFAKVEFARFFKLAISELNDWKNPGKEFLVCEVCGYTTMDMKLKKCPVCAAHRSKFELLK